MKKAILFSLKKRGLLNLVDSSENVSLAYLEKSDSNWISARALLDIDRIEEAVAILYYCVYNCVLSLLFRIGVKSESQEVSIYLLKKIFGMDNSFVLSLKKERISVQYYLDFNLQKNEVEDLFSEAADFNASLRDFISILSNEKINESRIKFNNLFLKNAAL